MLLLLVLGALGKRISKLGGGLLLAVYVAYLAILFTSFGAFR
jgi:hypothetical protein